MKVLVVSSPHAFSTRDVWRRAVVGLKANGIEVVTYDLLGRWQAFERLISLARRHRVPLPPGFQAQVLAYEPIVGAALHHGCKWVFLVSPQYLPGGLPRVLRRAGLRVAGYFTECPYEDYTHAPMTAAELQLVLVSDRYSVQLFRSFNRNSHYLGHSYDPEVHYPPPEGTRREGVVFVGTVYQSRYEVLSQIDWSGIPLELYGLVWPGLRRSKLSPYIRGGLMDNALVADRYRTAAAGFTVHRRERWAGSTARIDEGEAYSVCPRVFELAACGTFQVCDDRPEYRDVFGDVALIWHTPEDLRALLLRAISDPVWREEMAERQRAQVAGYTCAERYRVVAELMN